MSRAKTLLALARILVLFVETLRWRLHLYFFRMRHKYVSKLNFLDNSREIVKDWREFSHEAYNDMFIKMRNWREDETREWLASNRTHEFYSKPDSSYVYGLIHGYFHMEYAKKLLLLEVHNFIRNNVKGADIAEFGAGTGQACLFLKTCLDGKNVTYIDVPSRVFDFAAFRFKKYDANIKMLENSFDQTNLPLRCFDFIFSDAVLEHIVNIQQTCENLHDSLKPDGYLYILYDTEENFPSHVTCQFDIVDFFVSIKQMRLISLEHRFKSIILVVRRQSNSE